MRQSPPALRQYVDPAGFAGAGRLDRGVQRQQICLGRYLADDIGNRSDLADLMIKRLDLSARFRSGLDGARHCR